MQREIRMPSPFSTNSRLALQPGIPACRLILLAALCLLLPACSGISPYQPRNHREEGPEQGLFSGPRGAFEIGILPESTHPQGHQEETP